MEIQEIAILAINGVILGTILLNTWRVGKLEGRLKNGDFLRCPFYRKSRNQCK